MAVVITSPSWGGLRIFGPDAASWLQGVVTCDVLSVGPGQGAWGSLLSKQGKILADLHITGQARELIVGVAGGDAALVLSTLDGYLVMEDAEIETLAGQFVAAAGKGALSHLAQLLGPEGPQPSRMPWGVEAGLVQLSQQKWQEQPQLAQQLRSADPEQWDEFRISHGLYQFGVDYDQSDNLHAASLERRTVDWGKGCYVGQEVVCMQDMRGKVKRRLAVLCAETGVAPSPGASLVPAVTSGNEPQPAALEDVVGEIKSSAGKWAVATLKAPYFEPGTQLLGEETSLRVQPTSKS